MRAGKNPCESASSRTRNHPYSLVFRPLWTRRDLRYTGSVTGRHRRRQPPGRPQGIFGATLPRDLDHDLNPESDLAVTGKICQRPPPPPVSGDGFQMPGVNKSGGKKPGDGSWVSLPWEPRECSYFSTTTSSCSC